MFCDQNDDIEKFDLNIDERIVVGYSSFSKAYQVYKKVVMYFLMSLEELRSCKRKKILRWKSCFKFREMV